MTLQELNELYQSGKRVWANIPQVGDRVGRIGKALKPPRYVFVTKGCTTVNVHEVRGVKILNWQSN
jgi:hypothetical protein